MNKTVLILIINILFILNCIKSNNTFIINKNAEEYDLSQYLQIYIDNSLKLNYEDILTTSEQIKFINTKTENLSYGFKNAAFWLKFSILNNTDQPQNLIFGIFNSDINFIDFYENSNDSTIKKFFTGESRKFKDRDINHRYYLFNLKLEPGQSSSYYIRAYNNGDSMYLPLKFYQFNSYFQKDYINLIIIGFIFGLFLFIIIYNFFLFITINDKIYLFYSLYALFLSLFGFNIEGLSYQLFWPNLPWWANHSSVIFISISIFFLFIFSKIFLNIKNNSLLLNNIFNISSYAAILVTILSFFNYPLCLYSLFSAVFLCFVVVVSEIYASVIILKKNYKPAWYFIFAFIFMAAGVILYIMRDTGILDDNIWTYNGTKIGLVTQSLILSFAVLDRFRRITRDANRLLANQKNKIEEQKNILEKAILELKKLSLVASKTDNCITIFDKNADLEWVNSAFTNLYGFTLEELIKIKGVNIIKNSNHPNIESILNDCTANKLSISFQSSGLNKNKEIIWSQSTLSPILNDDDSIEKYIIIESDISLLKKYENDLIKAKEKAEQSDKLKTAFLSNMSHEIRTPMNAILGFANLLDDPDLTDKEKTYFVDLINKNSKNLLHLIDDILDIAKIEAGEIKITHAPCLLNSLFFEILSSFKSDKNLNKNIELLFNFDNNDPDFNIITDAFRLRQIITNLITNAFKFTEKGFIETGYQIKNSEILFYVKDTGIGIPDDKKELIFQRFIKVDHSNKSKLYGGTGIGLSICKNLIDLLNGKIWVESQLNQGSIFYFTLPYNNIQNKNFFQPETNNIIITNTIDWSDKTILIAEDELSNYELAKEMLRKTKVNLIWAKDGQSAINLYKQNQSKINLILMDIKMPELDGYEATKIIKSINQDIKIIALTAYALSGEKEISMQAGCNDYITKPINQKKLLQKIKFFFDLT